MDPRIKAGIFGGESGGDYDALFGFSNRPGKRFAGTKLTGMTVDEAIQFANPRGEYANWVRDQIGRTATPMGGYQIVGSTLKQAKEWAGLRGDEVMTPEIQDRLGQAILAKQGTGAWAGYKGPRDPATIKPTPDTSRAGVQGDYDPRLDTPSSGRPGGSELPGPPSQYDLVARHPPNPQVGTGGYVKPGAPTTGVGDVDSDDVIADLKSKPDKLAELGKGIMGGSLGTGGFNYQVPPVSQPGLAQAQPASMIDPQQASNKRQMLAYLMQRLNQGVLA